MDLELLWKGFIVGIVVSIPLGPIGILCIQRTVNKNWRSGYTSGLGAATSDTLYAVIAGFSLTIIVDFIARHEMLFNTIGAIIIIFLGWHIYQSHPSKEIQKFKRRGATYLQDYIITLLLTLSNPLAVFIFIAVFASSGLALNLSEPIKSLLIVGGVFLGASSWWLLITGIVNLFRHKFNLRILYWANKIVGVSVILFAIISFIYLQLRTL
jgi:threonine/homoserine/homoserine lactone efflux protein